MGKLDTDFGGSRLDLGIGCIVGQCATARRVERAERAGAERHDHPQDGVRRFRPLVRAGNAPGLRSRSLLVRSLLGRQ